eukprot:TRINITY_DN1639_c0_g1_i1.p1 TRINITY_DN1639_c0_g1~~TRINITY_DN1639_c0_g1_i1.p1  ORF type:complete len:289 (+),score=130.00 TRINITY_DN1639_c0_g1_i1:181-1047(+)
MNHLNRILNQWNGITKGKKNGNQFNVKVKVEKRIEWKQSSSCFKLNSRLKGMEWNQCSIQLFHIEREKRREKNEKEEEEEERRRNNERRRKNKRKEEGKEGTKSEKNTTIALLVVTVIVGLIGLSYASVPLYRMFCEATGYGGAVKEKKKGVASLKERRKESTLNAEDRPITIYFNADSNSSVQWKFIPQQRQVTIIPGESALAFYKAKNTTNEPIIGVATYNIAPSKAASYFNKIQCFCFEEQRLEPGEEIDLPVFFYLDPTFLEDPSMRNVTEMTLSYTFFKSKSN